MKKSTYSFFILTLLLSVLTASARAEDVRISVAGSLTDAIKEIIVNYEQLHPTIKLLPNFASSGMLAKQIYAGAPAAIYISANPNWMHYLEQQGLIASASKHTLVQNSLVFVGIQPGVKTLSDLPNLHRIAFGKPKSVPAGSYAKQALNTFGIYQQLESEQKLIMTKDVRQALLYADRGEVDGAFVYLTDALLAKQAKILITVPQNLSAPIIYPAALTATGEGKAAAKQFFDYLSGQPAKAVFSKYGFGVN